MNKVFLLFSLLLLLIATAVAPTPPVIQLTPTVTATSSITETATVVLTETATATATATTILTPTPSTTPTETATPTITPTPNNGRPELADELVLNSQLSDRFDEGSGDIAYYRLLAQAEVDYGCQVRAGGVDTLLRVWQGTTLISENDNQAVGDINPLVSWQIQAEAEREWILLEVVRLAGTGPYTVLCEANLTEMADPEINYSTTPIPHNGDPEQATELVLNNPLSDRFEAGRGDSAYYRLFAQPAVNYGISIEK